MAIGNKQIQLSIIISIVIMILAVFIYRSETNNEPQVIDPVYFDHSDYPVRVFEVAEIEDDIIIEPDVWITMRDGTRLSANIYRPDQPGTYPVVMAFTAYDKNRGPDGYPPHLFAFAHNYPRFIRFVQEPQSIHLDQITVPALIAATWSDQGLHTRGSFEGYKNIASEQKWLFTHGRQKRAVYYSDEALAMQKMFFDHFLKEIDNGMDDIPSVRLEIRESLEVYQVRFEEAWPLARTDYQALYLDGATNTLQKTVPATTTFVQYEPFSESATFTITIDEDIELTGNMKLKLWVSVSKGSDMDLFVGVRKLDTQGAEVYFYGKAGYNRAPTALGWLRVSERELDEERSTPWQPVLTHERAQKISRNEIVSVEIEIFPSSTLFRAGESLQLVIQGEDLFDHPALAHANSVNKVLHSIHTGGQYDSHLLIPVIP